MLRDQVRRSKKSPTKTTSKRQVRPAKAVSRSTSPKARTRRQSSPQDTNAFRTTMLIGLAVFCLLSASLWYGIGHLLTYATSSSIPQVTLLISAAATGTTSQNVWLLAESKDATPRYFQLSTQTELASGLSAGMNWSDAQLSLASASAPQTGRTAISQALGMPISRVVVLENGSTWNEVLSELRRSAFASIKQGTFTHDAVQTWLGARAGEGVDEPESIETIIGRISRLNVSPISSVENCPVAVLNNSGESGFASLVGRVIEQNGGTVLRIANALSLGEFGTVGSDTTSLIVHPDTGESCSQTLASLYSLFLNPQKMEDRGVAEQYRARVVLIVGDDARVEPLTEAAPDPRQ